MATQPSFGRRAQAEAQPRPAAIQEQTEARAIPPLPLKVRLAPPDETKVPSVEEEIEEWKKTRPAKSLPWRQIAFMASLCFGFASFALPDSINDFMQAPLIVLTVLSLCAGIAGWKKFGA